MKILSTRFILVMFSFALSGPAFGQAMERETVVKIFEVDPQWLPNGGKSRVWGSLRIDLAPWIYSVHFGWMYLYEDSLPSNYWIWIENLGWINSSAWKFPEAYHDNSSSLILLDLYETTKIRYWSFSDRVWRNLDKPWVPDFRYISVPDEIKHINYSSVSHSYSHSIEVGEFYFREKNGSFGGWSDNVYFYNRDGWFYPFQTLTFGGMNFEKYIFYDVHRYKITADEDSFTIIEENRLWGESSERTYPLEAH